MNHSQSSTKLYIYIYTYIYIYYYIYSVYIYIYMSAGLMVSGHLRSAMPSFFGWLQAFVPHRTTILGTDRSILFHSTRWMAIVASRMCFTSRRMGKVSLSCYKWKGQRNSKVKFKQMFVGAVCAWDMVWYSTPLRFLAMKAAKRCNWHCDSHGSMSISWMPHDTGWLECYHHWLAYNNYGLW